MTLSEEGRAILLHKVRAAVCVCLRVRARVFIWMIWCACSAPQTQITALIGIDIHIK